MKEQLITFETAKLAKEMGFQSYTSFYYSEGMEIKGTKIGMHGNPNAYGGISAPTQSLLQKWLREKHKIVVIPRYYHNEIANGYVYDYRITDIAGKYEDYGFVDDYKTYEEALEEGLVAALKIID